jgi:S-DNA-T family DNA segregation ATPase FtsK/SpoIIIE
VQKEILNDIFRQYGVDAKVVGVRQGPAVSRYEIKLGHGTRLRDIKSLLDDIIRIFGNENIQLVSPLEGGLIGVEVPRDDREFVSFLELARNSNLSAPLSTILGKDMDGNIVTADLSKMPHLLVAGATGSGKSVFINTLLCSVISRMSPEEVKLVLIDPKRVELSAYAKLPHLAYPLVTDPTEAGVALMKVVDEMSYRYELLSRAGVRNIAEYNETAEEKLPLILVVIDELADLMMVARRDVEKSIVRITQLARAAGIHLVVATQRPSVNVITGLIKANMPSRLSFAVSSKTDSRVILDQMGAEVLTGMGDSLFVPQGAFKAQRIQGAFISTEEVQGIVDKWKDVPRDEDQVVVSSSQVAQARKLWDMTQYVSVSMLVRNMDIDARTALAIVNKIVAEDNHAMV